MQKINSISELRNAIQLLEYKQKDEKKKLNDQFLLTLESIKPLNLIKSSIKSALGSKEIKNDLLGTSIGITTGYLSKKVFEIFSSNPLKKLMGSVIMFGISNMVIKSPKMVKSLENNLLKLFRHKPLDLIDQKEAR